MADWLSSMKQTYEFYKVNALSWLDEDVIDNIKSCTITRASTNATLGHATFDCIDPLDECYVRVYLITIQNGVKEKHCLGTYLIQTPDSEFDGKITTSSIDAYTPLIELKETYPPIGYALTKQTNIMTMAYRLVDEHTRAPVVSSGSSDLLTGNFVADLNETWLTFITDLIANANFEFDLDPDGHILFAPKQDASALQPVWTYDDSNSSILYPSVSLKRDIYGIPNVVEIVYSTAAAYLYSRVVNKDPNSPISTVNRGREIVHRITDPDLSGVPTQAQLDNYAEQILKTDSELECTITYTHGYCPVRVGDGVMLDYSRAGLSGVKAKVVSQSIKCETGCCVDETAVYTTKLWG